MRTVQRYLAHKGLRRGQGASERVGFGRFEAERPNELWVADALHGPVAATQRGGNVKRKAICFAILDDHSRLCVGAYFEPAETELRLERTLRAALQARGIPDALYVDNGSPFASEQLARACAVLGIRLIHSRPGRPEGRGKIERFFRTLREQFLIEAGRRELSLPELNRLLRAWLERSYHRRAHTETGESPAVRFAAARPRYVSDTELHDAFLWSVMRVVSKTATVSLHGNRYEVDAALCGRSVELIFDPYALGKVEVRWAGRSFGEAVAHEVSRHVHPRAEADLDLEPPKPTGIDYLALLETEHERDLLERSGGIEFRRLAERRRHQGGIDEHREDPALLRARRPALRRRPGAGGASPLRRPLRGDREDLLPGRGRGAGADHRRGRGRQDDGDLGGHLARWIPRATR